jgi:hypothetical protein
MPVLVGEQQIANFVQSSWPLAGSFLLAVFPLAIVGAIWFSRKEAA